MSRRAAALHLMSAALGAILDGGPAEGRIARKAVFARGTIRPDPKAASLRRAREAIAAEYDAAAKIAERLMGD